MEFFEILYNATIYPIEFIIEIVFYLFNNVFKSGYATSLLFLSLVINFISLPLYNIAESWQAKERAIQNKMKPMIENIKAVYKGDQRYLLIRTCQRINGYKTIYAFRGTLGLLIQIPFFLAAYNFIHNLSGLQLGSFLFIKDFSKPDAAINIGNITINILPFIMTLFSLLSGLVYSKKLKFKESLPLYIVSLIFLVLLYNSPSGLVFYWTLNCLFSLIKNIFIEYKLYKVFIVNKYKILRGYNIFFIMLTIIFLLLVSLSKIDRKGYVDIIDYVYNIDDNYVYNAKFIPYSKIFKQSDLFNLKIRKEKIPDYVVNINYSSFVNIINSIELNDSIENIGKIELYYSLNIRETLINIYLAFLFIFILVNLSGIENFILKYNSKTNEEFIKIRNQLFLISALSISALAGFFIPCQLISSSPEEFEYPFSLILNDLSMSLGLFLFYPLFIYVLFSQKVKNFITLVFIFLSSIVLINAFIFVGNYGYITSDFIFDNAELLKASNKDIFFNIISIIIVFSIVLFVILKNKRILINIYFIILIVLIGISIHNIFNIYKEYKHIKYIEKQNIDMQNSEKIFKLSKTGKNIFVFVLDMAVSSYWYDIIEKHEKYKMGLDGFVFFPNTVSHSGHTITVASLYGGYDYLPYEISTNGNYNYNNIVNNALLTIPYSLSIYGYKSGLLNMPYVSPTIFNTNKNMYAKYQDKNLTDYSLNKYLGINQLTNYNNLKKILINKKVFRFSIFRMMPIYNRYSFYRNGNWAMHQNTISDISYINYSLLLYTKDFTTIENNGNYYNALHNGITHYPTFFDSNYKPISGKETDINIKDYDFYKDEFSIKHLYANGASIECMLSFIEFLKNNNIYDNTKIIIVSDHALYDINTSFNIANTNLILIDPFNALLLYKDFNARGEIKIDTNFMTIADTPYLATKHIPNIKNPFNNKLITNDYKTNGAYILMPNSLEPSQQFSNRYNFNVYYHVRNNIFDINNWKKFVVDWRTKETKEIELK